MTLPRLVRALAPLLFLFGCLGPPQAADTAVSATLTQLYDARAGSWTPLDGPPQVGDELLQDGNLVRLTSTGRDDRGPATLAALAAADLTYDADRTHHLPGPRDWVLVLGDRDGAGHQRLAHVVPGDRFAWLGRIHHTRATGRGLEVRITTDVLARVTQTFNRQAPEVIDAVIAYDDGTEDTLTGTPNHPFWVPAVGDYVPLGELEVGTVLHVQGGGEAILVSKTWRQGEFEVFDFEVEGLHNFYVRGEGSDAAGVLVHNSTKPKPSAGLRPTQQNVSGPKVDRLAEDMKQNGFDPATPVKVDGEFVVDGHHRVMAADKAGVEIVTTPGGKVPDSVKADAPADFSEVNVVDVDY